MTTMCEKDYTIIGSGELVDHTVDFSTFNKISIEGQAAINVTYGNIQKVTISAQENIYEVMDNHVSNGELFIGYKNNTSVNSSKGIKVNYSNTHTYYRFFGLWVGRSEYFGKCTRCI